MKKNVLLILITIFILLFSIGKETANAASLNNKTAYSVGTDYKKNALDFSSINTTEDAEYAYTTYSSMGWNYKQKGGNYNIHITTGTGFYKYDDDSFGIGLGRYNYIK